MPTSLLPSKNRRSKTKYQQVALVLQGGGALGAYQAGSYMALAEAGYEPDWIAGISIGAISASIIAGHEPERRVERLRNLWERVTRRYPWPGSQFGNVAHGVFNRASAFTSLVAGQPDFFAPVCPPVIPRPHGAPGALTVHDTALLRDTLEELGDFGRIDSGRTRLNTDNFRQKHELRRAIVRLFDRLPVEARQDEEMPAPGNLGEDHALAIVHLICRPQRHDGQSVDYELSRTSMGRHWQAGLDDAQRSLRHPEWLDPADGADGLRVHDITQTDLDCSYQQEIHS